MVGGNFSFVGIGFCVSGVLGRGILRGKHSVMQGDHWIIRTDQQKANAAAAVATCQVNAKKPVCVKIEEYQEKRTKAQNRLFHQWCGEISQQGKEHTPIEVKAIAKLTWGVPLLIAQDDVFAELWSTVEERYDHETQLKMLEQAISVTKRFSVKPMSQFLNDMQMASSVKYQLTDPSLYGLT